MGEVAETVRRCLAKCWDEDTGDKSRRGVGGEDSRGSDLERVERSDRDARTAGGDRDLMCDNLATGDGDMGSAAASAVIARVLSARGSEMIPVESGG